MKKAGIGKLTTKKANIPTDSNFLNSLAASNCMLLSSEYNPAAHCVRFANCTRKILL
jgi:hypothetical protein